MTTLDRMFNKRVEGWADHRRGFEIEIKDSGIDHQRNVIIKPHGWPSPSAVACTFNKVGDSWFASKGTVIALHLGISLHFDAGHNSFGGLTITGSSVVDQEFLSRLGLRETVH